MWRLVKKAKFAGILASWMYYDLGEGMSVNGDGHE